MVVRIALPSYSTGTFYRVLQSMRSVASDPKGRDYDYQACNNDCNERDDSYHVDSQK